jgi:DNA ligase-1
MTRLADVTAAYQDVGATSARLGKVARLADLLRHTDPADVPAVVAWMSGELPQRQIGVGWAMLRSLTPPAPTSTLDVGEVDRTFSQIGETSGAGSQRRRSELLAAVFGRATPEEQTFLRRLLSGDLRQGALGGVMTDAIAKAAQLSAAEVRRAAMLRGDLPAVAAAALTGGAAALADIHLEVGRGIGPMLAQTAESVPDALTRLGGRAAFEAKLDGARVQVHRSGDEVTVYTRSLDDVTGRVPEIVSAVRALPASALVLDGEALALRPDGRPHPFQVTASRFGRRTVDPDQLPLQAFFFDLLHLDGTDLLDSPATERFAALDALLPPAMRVARLITEEPAAGKAFLAATLAAGHEGLVAKSLDSPYEAGRRGAGWLKIKPVHTLDLVVLAVEWGSGRRQGYLSNIHLGALEPLTGEFVMVGKTFKGMTDEMLAWQTKRFLALAAGPTDGWVVPLRPEQVVEIALDGVQRSSRYPGGVALRFARVVRYRDDKPVTEIDTIDTVRAMFDR